MLPPANVADQAVVIEDDFLRAVHSAGQSVPGGLGAAATRGARPSGTYLYCSLRPDREEAAELVKPGDPVTLQLGFQELRNNLAYAAGMDNRVGVWVVMNALRRVAAGNPKAAVFAVSTVQEEVGLRGVKTSAFAIDPQLGIAVDVTHATDCPTVDKKQECDVKLGGGPSITHGTVNHPKMVERLMDVAKKNDIPLQHESSSRFSGTDTDVIFLSRTGIP
ncbi:MAG: hypothetical protein IIC01_11525, partial [Planctomycetes bacterium]|nr:hypothetical protein [Planctomycetota bacterium]